MPLTEEQRKKYLDEGGVNCPYCGSDEIDNWAPDCDGHIFVRCLCLDCGKAWVDEYTLTGAE